MALKYALGIFINLRFAEVETYNCRRVHARRRSHVTCELVCRPAAHQSGSACVFTRGRVYTNGAVSIALCLTTAIKTLDAASKDRYRNDLGHSFACIAVTFTQNHDPPS
ncbi:hypothetical protein J6590_045430 [Homalodisca vitripennis]|nr:hypothetical protein J6590_045430 [Homalodisca vitripennis]